MYTWGTAQAISNGIHPQPREWRVPKGGGCQQEGPSKGLPGISIWTRAQTGVDGWGARQIEEERGAEAFTQGAPMGGPAFPSGDGTAAASRTKSGDGLEAAADVGRAAFGDAVAPEEYAATIVQTWFILPVIGAAVFWKRDDRRTNFVAGRALAASEQTFGSLVACHIGVNNSDGCLAPY